MSVEESNYKIIVNPCVRITLKIEYEYGWKYSKNYVNMFSLTRLYHYQKGLDKAIQFITEMCTTK